MNTTTPIAPLRIIAAVARNRIIGHKGRLPWKLPQEFEYFLRSTDGGALVMGRVCFEELLAIQATRAHNRYYVVSRKQTLAQSGAVVVDNLKAALQQARLSGRPIWICGGQQIYAETLPLSDELWLTLIQQSVPGDTHFPEWEAAFTCVETSEQQEENGFQYIFTRWVKNDQQSAASQ